MTFDKVIKHFGNRSLRVKDVRRYLEGGGDVNCHGGNMSWTLLHFSAEDCDAEMIKLLAAHGANLNARDQNGWTPLHLAVDADMDTSSRGARRATELPTVQTLIELGADERVKADDGSTPRDIAVRYDQAGLYDSLLRPRAA
ncbi:MAG TPA: ankyrin repeat domain-containing protein [Tepidisphaeraceae bacterium]|jgi:ankyrin repeat protein